MKTTVNFLEAVKALSEGKCEKIQSVKTRTTYSIDMDNNDTLSLRLSNGHDDGICLRCESFLGEWKLIESKQKIVIEDVVWVIGQRDCVYPDNSGKRGFCPPKNRRMGFMGAGS